MIAIVNRTESEEYGIYGIGEQLYSLQINTKILIWFYHNYEEGLATCLRNAADAFELYEINKKEIEHL
jgi:hypothetical protein